MAQFKTYTVKTLCRHCGSLSRQFDAGGFCSERCRTRVEVNEWVERFHKLEERVEALTAEVERLSAENEILRNENERLR